jgi:GNAT superfamily N-acetyltransferase
MTELVVRRAVAGDERALAALIEHVHALHVAQRPRVFKPLAFDVAHGWFGDVLTQPSSRVWLAEHDRAPLGYLLAMIKEVPESVFCYARRWYEVDQIAVAPGARRTGVARRLAEAAVSAARDEGMTDVQLATWAFNQDAQTAFQRLGFEPRIVRFARSLA